MERASRRRSAQKLAYVPARAVTYAVLFIGVVLVFLPGLALSSSGLVQPAAGRVLQYVGMVVAALGATLAVWCILTFVFVGRGTPAPFDPPTRLVFRGPCRVVRNPMYISGALALTGAALSIDRSPSLGTPAFSFSSRTCS